jgi:hypothetical protein
MVNQGLDITTESTVNDAKNTLKLMLMKSLENAVLDGTNIKPIFEMMFDDCLIVIKQLNKDKTDLKTEVDEEKTNSTDFMMLNDKL